MTGEWYELFDAAKSAGRATIQNVADMVATFNPASMKVPAIIGHSSGYTRGSKIPVGAWVEAVKQEGTKLLGKFRFPKIPSTPPPGEFAELQKFSEWFREAITGGMYETHSIGAKAGGDGRWRLREVAFLGQQQPECKGMPKVEFQEATDEDEWAAEFSEDDDNLIRIEAMPKIAGKVTDVEFSELNVSKLSTEELDALQKIVDMLIEDYSLGDLASCQQILGAMMAEEAQEQAEKDKAAAIGEPFVFNEQGKTQIIELIQASLKPIADKFQEFQDAAANNNGGQGGDPNAGNGGGSGDGGGANNAVQSLGKDDAACTAAADQAKSQLDGAKNWIPAWDQTLYPAMKVMANVSYNGGSLLDAFVSAMSVLPAVNDFMESGIADFLDIEEFAESKKNQANPLHPVSVRLAKNEKLEGMDKVLEFEEEAAKNGKTFEQVVQEHRARGEAV